VEIMTPSAHLINHRLASWRSDANAPLQQINAQKQLVAGDFYGRRLRFRFQLRADIRLIQVATSNPRR
jgi:hypothetical protein